MFNYFDHIIVFVDRFRRRSLRFCHIGFDKKAISDGCRSEKSSISWGFRILSDFKELSSCGPCGPGFFLLKYASQNETSSYNNIEYNSFEILAILKRILQIFLQFISKVDQ